MSVKTISETLKVGAGSSGFALRNFTYESPVISHVLASSIDSILDAEPKAIDQGDM
jgi:hypothetical protein